MEFIDINKVEMWFINYYYYYYYYYYYFMMTYIVAKPLLVGMWAIEHWDSISCPFWHFSECVSFISWRLSLGWILGAAFEFSKIFECDIRAVIWFSKKLSTNFFLVDRKVCTPMAEAQLSRGEEVWCSFVYRSNSKKSQI